MQTPAVDDAERPLRLTKQQMERVRKQASRDVQRLAAAFGVKLPVVKDIPAKRRLKATERR